MYNDLQLTRTLGTKRMWQTTRLLISVLEVAYTTALAEVSRVSAQARSDEGRLTIKLGMSLPTEQTCYPIPKANSPTGLAQACLLLFGRLWSLW